MKIRKLLPWILLGAILLSLVQGAAGYPQSLNGRAQSGAALAAEEVQGPIFLPFLLRSQVAGNPFGVDIGSIYSQNGLDEMTAAGAQWLRRGNYLWSEVEPTKGARNWAAIADIEAELAAASSRGLKTILVIQNTPEWARLVPASPCGPIKTEEFAAFAAFMHDLVARFSQPPYNIEYFEVYNEPDAPYSAEPGQVFGCWGNPDEPSYYGGEYYGEMLKVVYPQIKAASPGAKVVLGGQLMDCDPKLSQSCLMSKFLEGVLKTAANSFDILSFHTYDFYAASAPKQFANPNWNARWDTNGPALNGKLAYIRGLLTQYGVPNKPLMATEIALLCNTGCGADFEATKASFVAQSYVYSLVNGLEAAIWYDVFGTWRNNGLLLPDRTPLPAYRAYKTAYTELAGATYAREVTGLNNVQGFEFTRGDRRIWVLWAKTLGAQSVSLPGAPLAVYDVEGNSLAKNTSLSVTNSPVYVELSR